MYKADHVRSSWFFFITLWRLYGSTLSRCAAPPTRRRTRLIIFATPAAVVLNLVETENENIGAGGSYTQTDIGIPGSAQRWFHLRADSCFLFFRSNEPRGIFGGLATRLSVADQAHFFAHTMGCVQPSLQAGWSLATRSFALVGGR